MPEPVGNRISVQEWGPTTHHVGAARHRATAPGHRQRAVAPGHRQLTYAPGLDGVRALAVAAVVVYHLGAPWLLGGFIGVDVFFVLSGFLITSVLMSEFAQRGIVDIRTFYVRRARRLLPALFTMLAVVSLVTALVARQQLYRLRGDVVAALAYCTNWTQITWNRSYFAQLGPPSLLQHLWSLAVEEQFYLLWPLILATCLAFRRRFVSVAVVALALAGVSSLLMAVLFHPGQDPSRVYYGTDTHIAPMLLGAALAALAQRRASRDWRIWARLAADLVALGALVVLGHAAQVAFTSAGLYRGEYLVVWLAASVLVSAAAIPRTATATVLGLGVPRWLGERSYAIYLWHWPILVLCRDRTDLPLRGPPLVVAQLVAIVVAAGLSYRFVEHPIRTNGLLATLRGVTHHTYRGSTAQRRVHRRHRPLLVGLTLTGVIASVAMTLVSASGRPVAIQVDPGKQISITIPATPSAPRPGPGVPSRGSPAPTASSPPARSPFRRPVRVAFFGDSQGMTLLLNKPDGLADSIAVTDATVEGCGVLLGDIRSRIGFHRDLSAGCGGWAQLWAARARADRPQIAVVELGAWDVFDNTINGVTLRFGTPAWDAYFTRQLDKGVDLLVAAGAQVALMGVPCYRPIAAGGLPKLPERGDDRRTRHVTALLKAEARTHPGRVFMVYPPQQFCTNPSVATNTAYRWDGVHYYKPGAALTFQVITPQLLAIPQRPVR